MAIQYKSIPLQDVELKMMESGVGRFKGYASVFNGKDSYGDVILPGAYKKSLETYGMPKMFFGHRWDLPIGKWTLAAEDEKGLLVEGELTPGNPKSEAVLAALKHGTVDGLSVGFSSRGAEYRELEDGGREFKSIGRLLEISIVSYPADEAARITDVRSEELDEIDSIRDFENFLRDAGGFSKSVATSLVAKARKLFLDQREAEAEEKASNDLLERLKKLEESL